MSEINLTELMKSGVDHLSIVVSKKEIQNNDISLAMKVLSQLFSNDKVAMHFKERVDIHFDGYNDIPDELWEITEVRDYVQKLDSAFPYWLFFLSKNGSALYVILKCFLLPFLTPEAEESINTPRIQSFLIEKAFPALNAICDRLDVSENENEEISNRSLKYFFG
jgi:hypothetical protein